MKTFIVAFIASKGLPRTKTILQGVRIFNANSSTDAEEILETKMKKTYSPDNGWRLDFITCEVTDEALKKLLVREITEP